MAEQLRVGIVLDSFQVPAWVDLMLEKIEQGGDGKICLVILNQLVQASHDAKQLPQLYRLFCRLEERFSHPLPDAFALKDTEPWLSQVPLIKASPIQNDHGDSYPNDIVDLIKVNHLDVLVQLPERPLSGKAVEAARLGVWSIVPGDPHQAKRRPAGFWELFTGKPVTGSALIQKTRDGIPEKILIESYSATDPLSVRRNSNRIYWKGASFVSRKLKEARITGNVKPSSAAGEGAKLTYQPFESILPSNSQMGRLLINHAIDYLHNRWVKLVFHTQWYLLYDFRELPSLARASRKKNAQVPFISLRYFKELRPPRQAFWSDPFIFYREGSYSLFFEEFFYKQKKAHISVISIDKKGNFTAPQIALERPYHLSYPFVFEWQGEIYMIPETASQHGIEVYRCIEFPNHWEFYKTLMASPDAVDTTLFEYNGKWWMFTNIKENAGASSWDELFLFYSDSPLSVQWVPHPQNPIVSDVRSARPAGKIFRQDEKLYRPSQDSSQGYGYALQINEILALTESEYREERIATIKPDATWQGQGVHTFNFEEQLIVLDGKSRRTKFPTLV